MQKKSNIDGIDSTQIMEPRNSLIPESSVIDKIRWLRKKCYHNRINSLRQVLWGGSGHMGGAMSCAEILGVLYFWVAKHDPKKPKWDQRDRIILSKGHASPMLYATLASAGYFPTEELKSFRQLNSRLQGHPEVITPGVEAVSGSLGLGFSTALGMAIGFKYLKSNQKTFVILGDGEIQEGLCWEVFMAAGAKGLENFTAILDHNRIQQDGFIADGITLDPLEDKFNSFGWATTRVNGHDIEDLLNGFKWSLTVTNRPQIIIAETTKGHGISYMENDPSWHGTTPPNMKLFEQAIQELEEKEASI